MSYNQKSITTFLVLFLYIIPTILTSILDYSHNEGDSITIKVGPLSSIVRQIPYKYFDLGICVPAKIIKEEDNLGEILSGEEIYSTNYELNINKNEYCKMLCNVTITPEILKNYTWMIDDDYSAKWYLDKLPAGLTTFDPITKVTMTDYFKNIPLGYNISSNGQPEYYIYNHFRFKILVHTTDKKKYEIVGFTIMPISIRQDEDLNCVLNDKELNKNHLAEKQLLSVGNVLFTYDVIFEESDITMASRWDRYRQSNKTIHLGGVITANVIILIMSLVVLLILCKSLKRDIEQYNNMIRNDEIIDEFTWKQVCNDVFRPCRNSMSFCALIGTGVQLYNMLFLTLLFASLGFMKPEKRGSLLSLGILLFVFMGLPGGYTSAKMYKTLGGKNWLKTALLTAFFVPGISFLGFIIVNILLAMEKSSAAVAFTDIVALLVLWLCCSTPLVLIGSFIGIKSKGQQLPCKVNAVPTAIEDKKWYIQSKFTVWVAGLIAFSTVFIEFGYIMNTIWHHQVYYLAGFVWIALLMVIIVSGEISIILTYVNLCKGDYNWWWKSFYIGGSCCLYIMAYSVYYFFTLNIRRMSAIILYFGMMSLISFIVLLVCGALSTIITLIFLKKIYSMIKID